MDTLARRADDDLDLDALMVRVREAALAGGPNGEAIGSVRAGDANGADIDLIRVIDAQGEWNEQTRQLLAALLEGLRTLRDDWTDAHARLCEDVGQLSALVSELRTGKAATRSKRARAASATSRAGKRRSGKKRGQA